MLAEPDAPEPERACDSGVPFEGMQVPWKTRYYERICDQCGNSWRVPRAIARPSRRTMLVSGSAVSFNVTGYPGGGGDSSSLRDWQMIKKVERNLPSNAELAQRAAEDLGQCAQCGSEEYGQRPFHRKRHPEIEPER